MKTTVISYSLSGNNESLAGKIAKTLSAEHIKVTETKKRTTGRIIFDVIFNRKPKTYPAAGIIDDSDNIIFVGPVWMGKVASPFRSYLDHLKNLKCRYSFISISGGALGPNSNLEKELESITGRKPCTVFDMHIADLLPSDPKPDMKTTSSYRLNENDLAKLTAKSLEKLGTTK